MITTDPTDLVVLGPTGVTGRQIVAYLTERKPDIRWGVAGRSVDRIRESLDPSIRDQVPSMQLDLTDAASIVDLVQHARVVLNAAGPYGRLADPLWAACAATGTHYVDLCADLWWLGDAIASNEEAASANGARFVHSAGFLSLPFDLMTLVAAHTARERFDAPLRDIDIAISVKPDSPVLNLNDVMSGGTMASSVDVLRRGGDLAVRDVRMLTPGEHEPLPYDTTARQHPATQQWLAPMLPSPYVNPVIVHRTAARLADDSLLATDFRFRDGLVVEGGLPGVPDSLAATWLSGSQFLGAMLGAAPDPMRNLIADGIEAFLPRGGGPSDASLDGWNWSLRARGHSTSGDVVDLLGTGEGHLGYRSSANLAAETAVLIADAEFTDSIVPGIHTPGSALGAAAVERFESAGMRLSILD